MYLRLFYLNCNYRSHYNYLLNSCRSRSAKGFPSLQCPLSLCQLCVQSPKQMKYSSFGRATLQRQTLLKPFIRIERLNSSKPTSLNNSKAKKQSKFFGREMKKLLCLARTEKWNLSGAILLLLISSTITMAVPFALGKVIDLIYTTDKDKMRQNLNSLTGLLFLIFLIGGACNFGRVYLMNISGQRITKMLREKVFNSIMKQEVAFFDKNKTGELINRLSADTSLVSQCVTMNISDGLRSSVMVLVGCTMMFYMSAELAIVSLLIVPPVAGMAIIYGRFVRKITRKVQDSLADATQVAEERISNIRTVKSFGKEHQEMHLYRDKMQTVLNLATKEALARGVFFGMAGLSGNLVALSVLYYGGVQVASQGLSVGDLSAFILYAAYIGVSLSGLSSFYSEMNRGLGASERLFQIIDRQPYLPLSAITISPDVTKDLGRCEVVLKNVEFNYPEREAPVLCGVDLVLPAGKVTAVVGPSGSGKSTLAALILGLYEPLGGSITLNSSPLSSYPKALLTRSIASVPQEPILFSGSIRENILYGAREGKEVDQKELNTVMKEANVLDFVKSLPEGQDTLVGERGIALSGGQRQRIAIARALISNPRILLLDEATSALDAESEHLVQEALERIMKGRTVLTIAHRLSTIKNADQIAVLENGKVVELGSYEDLLKIESGVFKRLIKHQTFKTY